MQFAVTTAPTREILTRQEAKRSLRVKTSAEDKEIEDAIKAVREDLERDFGRSLLRETITAWFDADEVFDGMILPRPPLIEITSVTTYDRDNTATTVAATNYAVSGGDPARLRMVEDGFSAERDVDALRVIYVAGYGSTSTMVPYALRQEAKRRLWHEWRSRGKTTDEPVNPWPESRGLARLRYGHL